MEKIRCYNIVENKSCLTPLKRPLNNALCTVLFSLGCVLGRVAPVSGKMKCAQSLVQGPFQRSYCFFTPCSMSSLFGEFFYEFWSGLWRVFWTDFGPNFWSDFWTVFLWPENAVVQFYLGGEIQCASITLTEKTIYLLFTIWHPEHTILFFRYSVIQFRNTSK